MYTMQLVHHCCINCEFPSPYRCRIIQWNFVIAGALLTSYNYVLSLLILYSPLLWRLGCASVLNGSFSVQWSNFGQIPLILLWLAQCQRESNQVCWVTVQYSALTSNNRVTAACYIVIMSNIKICLFCALC